MTKNTPAPKARWWRRWLRVVLLGLAAFGLWMCRWLIPPPALVVSKETTFITQPLLPSGVPDYVAAINAEWSRGVTPENNAMVLLLQVFDPAVVPESTRAEYYKLLGVAQPSAEGDHLESLYEFIDARTPPGTPETPPESDEIVPFTAEERPLTAASIEANAGPGELLLEATRRSQYYSPLVLPVGERGLMDIDLWETHVMREAGRFLAMRAMLRLQRGDVDQALIDAVACLRVGRFMGYQWCRLGNMIGSGIERHAVRACEHLLLSKLLSAEQLTRLRTELEQLPPTVDWKKRINGGERLAVLMETFQNPESLLSTLGDYDLGWLSLNPNQTSRAINRGFDSMITVYSGQDSLHRMDKLESLREDYRRRFPISIRHDLVVERDHWRSALLETRSTFSEKFGSEVFLISSYSVLEDESSRQIAASKLQLLQVAVSIDQFRLAHGTYPKDLQELTPAFIASVPLDLFIRQPLRYSRHGDSYLLYSVGRNGIDDQGRQEFDGHLYTGNPPDDIRFGLLPPSEPVQ